MTRRKSVCLKWTLVLLVVLVCPYVQSRPQDASVKEITTENIRYRFDNISLGFKTTQPIVISNVSHVSSQHNHNVDSTKNKDTLVNLNHAFFTSVNVNSGQNRNSRLIKGVIVKDMSKNRLHKNQMTRPVRNQKPKPAIHKPPSNVKNDRLNSQLTKNKRVPNKNHEVRKPAIRKVLTKWKDETKYEDLHFYETTSEEIEPATFDSNDHIEEYTSTETTNNHESGKKPDSKYFTAVYKPQNQYSEETHVYSTNVQIDDKYPTQSTYMYTKRPNPTPEITNVGYPKPWKSPRPQIYKKPTTQKPVQATRPLNYNSISNYPSEYEVTTFLPASAYTERIVIRPEEYSASNDECPTIYLTLNNTFQGQAKEACPDLNIAVNTNVFSQNNVIETEEDEDDDDGLFPNGFGIPLADDSLQDLAGNDYSGSIEPQGDSASVEGTELSSYNAANALSSESGEPGSAFFPSSQISAISKPSRPNKDDDEIFSFSSLVEFFRPAISALGWLTSINPFAIGLFPIILAPIAFLFAGSGVAALFSPLFLPLGREAPKVIHVYRPHWHWDDNIKTWHLHSFPNRNWKPSSRSSTEEKTEKLTLFEKLRRWMLNTAKVLRERNKLKENSEDGRKNKRRKREVWSIRVK